MLYLGQKSRTPSENYRLESKSRGFVKRRHYTETVYIIGDTLADNVDDVRADPNLPTLYEARDNCYCVGISPKEVATIGHPVTGAICSLWEVTLEWDSDVGTDTAAGGDGVLTPDNRPPQYKWTAEQFDEAMYQDLNGVAIATPTGERITCMMPQIMPILEIHRNEPFPFDPDIILIYQNTICNHTFWGFPAFTSFMRSIETDYPFAEGGYVYVPVTYRIAFHVSWVVDRTAVGYVADDPSTWTIIQDLTTVAENPWQYHPACAGLYYYDTAEYDAWVAAGLIMDNKPKPRVYSTDQTGYNIKEVFLDKATGKVKADQTIPDRMSFVVKRAVSWTSLNLQPWWWNTTTTTT